MEPLLRIIDLKKLFKVEGGLLHAVDGINLDIPERKTLGVVGESGCGKSTLGRIVVRLLKPTSGTVLFGGQDIFKTGQKEFIRLRQQMQIIFQDPYSSLNPRMSVFDLIAEPLVMNHIYKSNLDLTKRVTELMDIVGLADRFISSYPHEMDGGRRQRVGVARALALKPKFIVCDEPVSALDVSIQAQILNLLMDLQEEMGLTYMFITHDLSVVKHISDEIAVMYLGQCVEKAESKELFKNPLHPYTKALLSAIPIPDPSQKMIQHVIRGEVSDPINPKPGCRFANRCGYCQAECIEKDIALHKEGENHLVACHLFK